MGVRVHTPRARVRETMHGMTRRYLSRAEVAERIGVVPPALSRYKLPPADVMIGSVRGWLPETIDRWHRSRPGSPGRPNTRPVRETFEGTWADVRVGDTVTLASGSLWLVRALTPSATGKTVGAELRSVEGSSVDVRMRAAAAVTITR